MKLLNSPINNDPSYYKPPNPYGLAEAYLRNIWQDVHVKKFSYLCTLTGRHRVGKSLAALVMAHILDETFWAEMELRVVYTPEEFFAAVESLDYNKIVGGAIVWDEANLGIPSREWYNLANRSINYAIQAFGYLRPMVFFVTQDITFIDSQPRKLFHDFFEIKRTNNEYSSILPFDIRINKRSGKMYFVYPRFFGGYKGNQGARMVLKPLKMMKPPREMIKRYEKHSIDRKRALIKQMKDIVTSLKRQEDKAGAYRLNEEEIITNVLGEKDNPLFVTRDGTFRVDAIKREFKIPYSFAHRIKIQADVKIKKIREEEV